MANDEHTVGDKFLMNKENLHQEWGLTHKDDKMQI